MVNVIFSRRHHLGSVLLRTGMWSPWSHCGVIEGDTVIQAAAGMGVVRTPLAEFKRIASRWAVVEFPASETFTAMAAASQIGKPYDLKGAIGVAVHRNWDDDDAWFCSELVAYALQEAGLPLFREGGLFRVTPQHLWMLNYPVVDAK